jgi:hypothetical protein
MKVGPAYGDRETDVGRAYPVAQALEAQPVARRATRRWLPSEEHLHDERVALGVPVHGTAVGLGGALIDFGQTPQGRFSQGHGTEERLSIVSTANVKNGSANRPWN